MNSRIEELIADMTLEEKASLCSGANWFETKSVERLGIPRIQMFDGPNGLRKNAGDSEDDQLGNYRAVQSTCFPTGSAMAASWDTELLEEIGKHMGQECQAENVPLLLGPSINMKRSPLCGRNFEYLTEDPYLGGKAAAALVRGIQSCGVGACLKHFAANNQEDRRSSVNNLIDERTLREIYLTAFEIAVKEAQPWTIMCAYNQVNGQHCCKNRHLLTEILREEWGYQGFVMTDWGAMNDPVASLEAGLELEMPGDSPENTQKIIDAVRENKLEEKVLDQAMKRLLEGVFLMDGNRRPGTVYDRAEHHRFARKAAAECMVLLKNEDEILPLKPTSKVCLIGEMAEKMRYQGGGSSHVTTSGLDNILQQMREKNKEITYAKGYELEGTRPKETLIEEACMLAERSDVAVIIAGLPEEFESEGFDRKDMKMPASHVKLIEAVSARQPNVVVVLLNGSPVEMDWEGSVKGILEAYLGGQAAAGAVSDLLYGDVNPSGKLAESFPLQLEDNPSFLNYDSGSYEMPYAEGVYIGYRYYTKKKRKVRYPFGHGLSYTRFQYSNLKTDASRYTSPLQVQVKVSISNVGQVSGKEVVQLYVAPENAQNRPVRELKGFGKVELAPGETKEVTFTLSDRAFAYYDVEAGDWIVKDGIYRIEAAASSEDIRLTSLIEIYGSDRRVPCIHEGTIIGELMDDPRTKEIVLDALHRYVLGSSEQIDPVTLYNMSLRHARFNSRGAFREEYMEETLKRLNHAVRGGK